MRADEATTAAPPNSALDVDTEKDWTAQLLKLSGLNARLCPCCNGLLMRRPLALLDSS